MRFLDLAAGIGVIAQTGVSVLGVTVLPDAAWSFVLVIGSAVAAGALIVWATISR